MSETQFAAQKKKAYADLDNNIQKNQNSLAILLHSYLQIFVFSYTCMPGHAKRVNFDGEKEERKYKYFA